MRKINEIFLHCSATQNLQRINAETIRRYHVDERGWQDIGYHKVVTTDGAVEEGRDIEIAGAHAKGFNRYSIGICVIGGINSNGETENNFTQEQFDALSELIKSLLVSYPTIKKIRGHCDVANKACPVFDVQEFLTTYDIKVG